MTPENFVCWLQGFAELNDEPPTAEQWVAIKAKLSEAYKVSLKPVPMDFIPPFEFYDGPSL